MRVEDEHAVAVAGGQRKQFAFGVGKVGDDRSVPGAAFVFGGREEEPLRFAVVAEECIEAVVGQDPEDRFVGTKAGDLFDTYDGKGMPVVEGFDAADQHADIEPRIAAGENPVVGGELLRREVVDGIVVELAFIDPLVLLWLPAVGDQFQVLFVRGAEGAVSLIFRRQGEQLTVAEPETAGNERVGLLGSASDRFCFAPVQSIDTGGVLDFLGRFVFDAGSVAPDTPELAVMINEVVVQVQSQVAEIDLV